MRDRTIWWLVGALIALRVVVVIGALSTDATAKDYPLSGDIMRFHEIAVSLATPYLVFEVEYPPVTLGAIELLEGGSFRSATVNLMVAALGADVLILAVIIWAWGVRAGLVYLVLGIAFVLDPFIYLRVDLLSVALAIGAVALLRRRHPRWAGALLAIACFAKIWPIALVPLFFFARNRKGWLPFAAISGLGLSLWIALWGVDGVRQVATFRGSIGWEIESLIGSIIRLGPNAVVYLENGAYRVDEVPGAATPLLLLLGLAAIALVWLLVSNRPDRESPRIADGLAPLAAICATLVTATIISPQYLFWMLPFTAIAAIEGERLVAELVMLASALSVLEFARLDGLVAGDRFPVLVVLFRNVVLIALLVLCFYRLAAAPTEGVDTDRSLVSAGANNTTVTSTTEQRSRRPAWADESSTST